MLNDKEFKAIDGIIEQGNEIPLEQLHMLVGLFSCQLFSIMMRIGH